MAVGTRVKAFERSALLQLSAALKPEEQGKRFAAFARQQLSAAQAQDARVLGFTPEHETFVDGRAGANEDSVRMPGTILYRFILAEEVLVYISELLVQNSPVRTGRYSASHVLYADSVEVPIGQRAPPASEYIFTNAQPYARKIERGLSPQAPEGVFEAVAALAAARYGNVALIKFTYQSPMGGQSALEGWAGKTTLQRHGRRAGDRYRATWLRRQPAIIVTLR